MSNAAVNQGLLGAAGIAAILATVTLLISKTTAVNMYGLAGGLSAVGLVILVVEILEGRQR